MPQPPSLGQAEALGRTVRALRQQADVRSVAEIFSRCGISVLLLKGPDLQARLYGNPAVYASGDVDVLVRRKHARRARQALVAAGWSFEAANTLLWRLTRAAHFEKDGERLDLHWGLHAAHLPAFVLRGLERELWERAEPGPSGAFIPDDATLLVYLAVHAAGHAYERPHWVAGVGRAADVTKNWDRVWLVARRTRLTGTLKTALQVSSGAKPPRVNILLDGPWGIVVWAASFVARAHFLSRPVRIGLTHVVRRFVPLRTHFAGAELVVGTDVFFPQPVTEELARAAVEKTRQEATVVDVGTGSGAVALAIGRARPDAHVLGIDISSRALRWARRNRRRLKLSNVDFVRGSLLAPVPEDARVSVVTANMPYIPPDANATESRPGVPRGSLVGAGPDGLDLVRAVARDAIRILEPGGRLVLQAPDDEWDALVSELVALGYERCGVNERRPGRAVVGWAHKPES